MTHLTNASGAVIEKYKYDAFGAVTILAPNGAERATSLFNNRFLFTGREYAATFGFYEYRARAYNPTLGRFMSEDPKGFDAGDYNLFRSVGNDPLDRVDPMGLADESVNAKMVQVGTFVNVTMHVGSHIATTTLLPVVVPAAALVELRASYAKINEQKLSQLGSVFRPMASRFIGSANEMLNSEGYEVKIADQGGYRSFAEQARLRAIYEATGKNQANRPGESAHNYGAAIDIDIIKGSRAITMDVAPHTYNSLIGRLGALGERQGLIWGGHFSKPDPPHFQHPGIPLNGPDMLRLHQQLLRTTGAGLDALMGVP